MTGHNPLTLVISGGQTGADQGGLHGARDAGVRTGGSAPKGWRTENGAAPWLADFGLVDTGKASYAARTRINVGAADGTVILGDLTSKGSALTERCCKNLGKPLLHIPYGRDHVTVDDAARQLSDWIGGNKIAVLNVAGNRESGNIGIADFARAVVFRTLMLLKERG